jgi:hypothetical protein
MDTEEEKEITYDMAVTVGDLNAGGGEAVTVCGWRGGFALMYRSRAAVGREENRGEEGKVEQVGEGEKGEQMHGNAVAISTVGCWRLARRAGIAEMTRVNEVVDILERVVDALLLPVLTLAQLLPQSHSFLIGDAQPRKMDKADASSLNRLQVLTAIRSAHGYTIWGSERGYTYSARTQLATDEEEEEEWERQEQVRMLRVQRLASVHTSPDLCLPLSALGTMLGPKLAGAAVGPY